MIVNTSTVTITASLLNELAKNNISTVFCDEKHNPSFEISAFSDNINTAGKISDQILWKADSKLTIWQKIVEQKIKNQRQLLETLNIPVPDKIIEYENSVLPGDESNREGLTARIYFRQLFGSKFKRHFPDNINAALNYGYTLMLSSFNRILTIHGYNTSLGIKHSNRQNKFNLSCDLMEPFRPFIDKIVYSNQDRELDWNYKRMLINSFHNSVKYNNKELCVTDAFEMYTMDVMKSLEICKYRVKGICLD